MQYLKAYHQLVNDPGLPSYRSIFYQRVEAELQYVSDAWEGKKSWVDYMPNTASRVKPKDRAPLYLPPKQKEPADAYAERLQRSLYKNFFRKILTGFADILTDFQMETPPPSFEEWISDVDGKGNTFEAFISVANQMALRDGFVGIYIDLNTMVTPTNRQEEIELQPRPVLKLIDRRAIPNGRGRQTEKGFNFTRVTIIENVLEPDGEYGDVEKTYYRRITESDWRLLEIVDGTEVLIEEGANDLGVIPLVLHSLTELEPLETAPPSTYLADLTFSYYNLYSSYREVMERCNLPVPTRKGLYTPGMPMQDVPPLYLGTNHVVDLPAEGDFTFVEPTGAALEATKVELESLSSEILNEGLAFSSRDIENKTATEVELSATQVKANIYKMASMFESSAEKILYYWALWTNEGVNGSIIVNRDTLEPKIEAQLVTVMLQLAGTGFLSRNALLRELQNGGLFSKEFDIDEELALGETGIIKEEEETPPEGNNGD